jgi:pimeloyl-ACP methyl ester carboxylesterase
MKTDFHYKGAKLAYQKKGKGRTIVLIHGFLGSSQIWKEFVPRLSKRFQLITVDLFGHGESDCLGYVHNMELQAEGINSLLKHLSIRKAVFVGHSLGGYVSLALAEKYPDKVLGLVMLNSTAKGDSQQKKKSRNQLIQLVKENKERAIELLIPTFFQTNGNNARQGVRKYKTLAKRCNEQGIVANLEGMKIRKEREIVLKFAPFPYLYLIGKYDTILAVNELVEESNLNEKGEYLLLEETSHMGFYEEQEKVFKAISNFSKSLGNGERKNKC